MRGAAAALATLLEEGAMPNLKGLDLHSNQIGDAGVSSFAASPPWRAEARSAKWAALNCTAFEASVMDNHPGDVTDHRVPRTVDQHLGARRAW